MFMQPRIRQTLWLQCKECQTFQPDCHGVTSPCPECGCSGEFEIQEGFGARLDAPGYLDCTEWAVYATFSEAVEGLREMYCDGESGGECEPDKLCPMCQALVDF